MKKNLHLFLLACFAAAFCSLAACTLPYQPTEQPTIAPPPTSGPTPIPTQAEPTIPPPELPTLTPAPATPSSPLQQIDAANHALFNGDWETAKVEFQQAWDAATSRGDNEVQAAAQLGLGRV